MSKNKRKPDKIVTELFATILGFEIQLLGIVKSFAEMTNLIDELYSVQPDFLTELARPEPFGVPVENKTIDYFIKHVFGNTFRAHSGMILPSLIDQLFTQNYIPGNLLHEKEKKNAK